MPRWCTKSRKIVSANRCKEIDEISNLFIQKCFEARGRQNLKRRLTKKPKKRTIFVFFSFSEFSFKEVAGGFVGVILGTKQSLGVPISA